MRFTKILLLFLAILFLSSCSRELMTKKHQILSKKELQEKGNIPEQVFYDAKQQKMAISYVRTDKRKVMAFYDLEGDKPIFYFETPLAEDVFKPFFAKDFQMVYAILSEGAWRIFLRSFVSPEPLQIMDIPNLVDMALEQRNLKVLVAKKEGNRVMITPRPTPDTPSYLSVSDLFFDEKQGLQYRALKENGDWIVFSGQKESESFTFVSSLARSDEGEPAYIARRGEKDWMIVNGDNMTPLKKVYQEIGQIFFHRGRVYFSGVEKGQETWEISKENEVLISNLSRPPKFIVRKNGKIATVIQDDEGSKLVTGKENSAAFSQIDEVLEDSRGDLYVKVKNKFSLWQVVGGDKNSAQYVWMSEMFLDHLGQVFFFGMTSDGDFEIFRFYHK